MTDEPKQTDQLPRDDDGYQLLDFGEGRKLEQFGSLVLDRPSPAAAGTNPRWPARKWRELCDLSFDGSRWTHHTAAGKQVAVDGWRFNITPQTVSVAGLTPAGHVGVFPEHFASFERLVGAVTSEVQNCSAQGEALHLFAYTGIGSIQLARAGYAVTHVDASRPAIQWAKANIAANASLDLQLTIRTIVDDAVAFAQREVRRGRRYDLIVLDPPAYGHGPKGNAWRIERDLPVLLECLISLLDDAPRGFMISGHSDGSSLLNSCRQQFAELSQTFASHSHFRVMLPAIDGRKLDAGYCFQWSSNLIPHF